jgi:hypothetical protein
MLSEQGRVVSQITETTDVIAARRVAQQQLRREADQMDQLIDDLAADLN